MSDLVRSRIDIDYPYTHSTGPVVGRALAALRARVILGARCSSCETVNVPARDWCERCGSASDELVRVGPAGTATVVTGGWALILLDGADTAMVHRITPEVRPGARVRPLWRAEQRGAITDIEAFEVGAPPDGPSAPPDERVEIFDRPVELPFTLSAGTVLSRFYSDIREHGRLHGVRCTDCRKVLVPPRVVCPRCWADTESWIEVADRGIVTSFVVVNVPFHGQQMELPYVLAWVRLDGADTSFLHILGEVAPGEVRMGLRVEAVWRAERTGFPNDDIDHFRPTGEPDAPLDSFIESL